MRPGRCSARAELVVVGWFLGLNLLAIAAKWTLIGRARPTTIKLWSVAYFRFWVARRLIALAPAYLFVGEPLFNLFLRCLGAKIGARAVIATAVGAGRGRPVRGRRGRRDRAPRDGAGLRRGRARA